jgi:hypothetical protein
MRGPRKLGGTLQVDPTNVRIIRCFTVGTGSAKDAVAIDFSTTTHGLFHAAQANEATTGHKGTIAGVALEAWTAAGQIIAVQVLGPVTEVAVNDSVVVGDKLVAGAVAGRLARAAALSSAAEVRDYTALGIATTVGAGSSGSQTASVYLLNPLGL